jgi:hypothetical protein
VRTVGVSTDGHGRATPAAWPGLTCAAESGVLLRVSVRPTWFPGTRAAGKAGAVMAGLDIRASVTVAGRSGRGSPARA